MFNHAVRDMGGFNGGHGHGHEGGNGDGGNGEDGDGESESESEDEDIDFRGNEENWDMDFRRAPGRTVGRGVS